MRRIAAILILGGASVALCWFIATLPGDMAVALGRYQFSAPVPVALLIAILTFLLLYALLRLIAIILGLPRQLRRHRQARQRRIGDMAVTRTLLALAAGNGAAARQSAKQARLALGDTPHTLLLAAQAGHAGGRDDEATEAFATLAERDDAAFLGLRGLLRQAVERQDWQQAADLARRAEAAHPGATWLRAERTQLALRGGAWRDALALTPPDQPRLAAALATAAANAEPDPAEARRLAKQAFAGDPALPVAALAYARRLREAGRDKRARAVLRQAWEAQPHPDLATAYLEAVTDDLQRLRDAGTLIRGNPDHPESRLLQARLALAAGLPGEANRHIAAVRAEGLDQRRLWLLIADIAAASGSTEAAKQAQHDALRRAATAEPDPTWRCTSCGTAQPHWAPVCPVCQSAGRIAWAA